MRKAKQFFLAMLASVVAVSLFSGTALGASTRYALVTEITGTVKVTKAGGTKEMKVFNGMGLNEGDKLKVEKGSSLTVKIADTNDEIVLSENWSGAVSKLKTSASGGKDTAVKAWSGAVYSKVEKLTGTSNTYKVETPTAVMGVRGTDYTISMNPDGTATMFVHSGFVRAGDTVEKERANVGPIILPAQMIDVYPNSVNSDQLDVGVEYTDLQKLVEVDPVIIKKILLGKPDIDVENDEKLPDYNTIQDLLDESALNLDEETLAKYKEIVDNSLFHLLKAAVDSNTLNTDVAKQIVEEANRNIQSEERQYDLNKPVPPIDKTVGVNPAAEAQRKQQQEAVKKQQQAKQEEKQKQKEEFAEKNKQLLETVENKKVETKQTNTQKEEDIKQKAIDKKFNETPASEQATLLEVLKKTGNLPTEVKTPEPTTNTDPGTTPVASPTVTVSKVDVTSSSFNVVVKLSDFKDSNAVYGAQLHFVHDTTSDYVPIGSTPYFASTKYATATTAESLRAVDGTLNGVPKTETIYAMTAFGAGTAASFSTNETFVTIPFTTLGSGSIKLVHLQLVRADGTTITVSLPAFDTTYGAVSS